MSKSEVCTGRVVVLFLLCALIAYSQSVCGAPPKGTAHQPHSFNLDGVLAYFSDYGLLVDRGIARSPLGGTVDEWIAKITKENDAFREYLDVTAQQLPGDEQQRKKLLLVYLNLEGLMAIRRPEFRDLIGLTPDEQHRISQLSTEEMDRARLVHLQIFSLQNQDIPQLPKLILKLRRMSTDLDWKIVKMLTRPERVRLAKLVVQAAEIGDLIYGSDGGCTLEMLERASVKTE